MDDINVAISILFEIVLLRLDQKFSTGAVCVSYGIAHFSNVFH